MKTIPKRKPKTHLQIADKIPPFLCIALARTKDRDRVTLKQISEKAGVSKRMLDRLMVKTSWASVKLVVVDAVNAACGISLHNINEQINYVRKTCRSSKPFQHLTRRQWRTLVVVMKRWLAEQQESVEKRGN